jgi:hypothetical protein
MGNSHRILLPGLQTTQWVMRAKGIKMEYLFWLKIIIRVLLIAAPFYILFTLWLLYLKHWADEDNARWSPVQSYEFLDMEDEN